MASPAAALTKVTYGQGEGFAPAWQDRLGFEWYARMTDANLSAVVAYLRTMPPKE
jgi:hypothetical protein